MNKYISLIALVLFVALSLSVATCKRNVAEKNRLKQNQTSLLQKANYYRTKDSLSVASVDRLTLTKSELSKHCEELTKTCNQLNIKLKHLQSASVTATETTYNIKTVFRDSLVVRDSLIIDTIRCVEYQDPWLTFSGCTSDDINFDAKIQTKDTLTTIIHRIPKKFLFFRWGCKAIRQKVISKNPHSNIVYTEYIELK